MELIVAYIQGILETMVLVCFTQVFSRVRIRWGRTIIASMVISITVLLIKTLPIEPGVHIVVSVLMIFLFIVKMTRVPKPHVFIAVFASLLCLATFEYGFNLLFISLDFLHPEDVSETSHVWMIMGYVQAVLMNLLAVLLQLFLKPRNDWKSKTGAYEDSGM